MNDSTPNVEWPEVFSFWIPAGCSQPCPGSAYAGANAVLKGQKYGVLLKYDAPYPEPDVARDQARAELRRVLEEVNFKDSFSRKAT